MGTLTGLVRVLRSAYGYADWTGTLSKTRRGTTREATRARPAHMALIGPVIIAVGHGDRVRLALSLLTNGGLQGFQMRPVDLCRSRANSRN